MPRDPLAVGGQVEMGTRECVQRLQKHKRDGKMVLQKLSESCAGTEECAPACNSKALQAYLLQLPATTLAVPFCATARPHSCNPRTHPRA